MIIVIIHWKIHPNEESRNDFFEHWKNTLTIDERSHLIGEFLSKPLPSSEVGFQCSVINTRKSKLFDSYFNVGIWDDLESFENQIIKPFVGSTPKTASFEYEYRERMVLSPQLYRIGEDSLPPKDNFVPTKVYESAKNS